ncbi:MAG: ABC transporter permease [Candidatus Bathyarchaeota archaeon]|nr:ABC transporter permease [Candidatus Bathyarchaeota archaeon]MDH5734185.1 ABC transporter permease [Candidatus Bathyarchaeota archaeon]
MTQFAQRAVTWSENWRRFRKNKAALIGGLIVLAVVITAIIAPVISPYNPDDVVAGRLQPPSNKFWFGTDGIGRDCLSRVVWGSRTALMVGLGASLISVIVGVAFGSIAGYYGGIIDDAMMRICEILLVIPSFFLYILIVSIFRVRGPEYIAVLLALTGWTELAKIVRVDFFSLKEREFTKAAIGLGASDIHIIFRYLLPNDLAPIIVVATMNIAGFIIMEAALSFIGLGDPTACSWGIMLSQGRQYIGYAWWLATFPGLATFITAVGFNFLGDGLRDSLDPRLRGTI